MLDGAGFSEMDLLASAAAGMSTQRSLLDIAARNVAAAQASTPDHPYSRLVASFAPPADADAASSVPLQADATAFDAASAESDAGDDAAAAPSGSIPLIVRTEPSSGDALTEMIAVLDAQRAYEQHASVFDVAKRLAERTIDLGRG
jgi:flagellar basal body rod protein FlgC